MRRSRKPLSVQADRRFKSSPLRYSSGLGSGAGLSSRAGGLQNRCAQSVAVHEGLQRSTRSSRHWRTTGAHSDVLGAQAPGSTRATPRGVPQASCGAIMAAVVRPRTRTSGGRMPRRVRCDRPRGTSTTSPRLPGVTATNWVTTCAPSLSAVVWLADLDDRAVEDDVARLHGTRALPGGRLVDRPRWARDVEHLLPNAFAATTERRGRSPRTPLVRNSSL